MTQRFIQLSDPHLSSLAGVQPSRLLNKRLLGYLSWRRKRRFEHRSEVLDALLDDIGGLELDQILVTGDLTHIGLPMECQQVRDWLPRLGGADQVALVPGNHDACVAAPWDETQGLWEPYMRSDTPQPAAAPFPSLRIRGELAFIGVSTACPTPPLMATGRVDESQLQALPALLDECQDKGLFRILYLHHSPVVGMEKWRKRLVNADAVAGLVSRHGAELVLHGHGHRSRRDSLPGRHGEVPVRAVPSASALGLHGADVAAFHHFRVDRTAQGWRLAIRTRQYDTQAQHFADSNRETLEISR